MNSIDKAVTKSSKFDSLMIYQCPFFQFIPPIPPTTTTRELNRSFKTPTSRLKSNKGGQLDIEGKVWRDPTMFQTKNTMTTFEDYDDFDHLLAKKFIRVNNLISNKSVKSQQWAGRCDDLREGKQKRQFSRQTLSIINNPFFLKFKQIKKK